MTRPPIAAPETRNLPVVERSAYDFRELARLVPRQESHEPLVNQTFLESKGIICDPFWDATHDLEGDSYRSYIKIHPDFSLSVRAEVAERLLRAQQTLPTGWQLVLKAGFRPYDVQLAVFEAFIDKARTNHPQWSEHDTREYVRLYVSDPSVVCPPHVTGGAIDVDVRDKATNLLIDMGCSPNTDGDVAHLYYDDLTEEQKRNRMTLLNAMLAAGFAPFASEWWHFQYGETYWAAFYGRPFAQYDLITL